MGSPNDEAEMHVNTDGSGIIQTLQKLKVEVGATLDEHVVGAVTETYDATQTTTVNGLRKAEVGMETLTVKAAHIEKSGGLYHSTRSASAIHDISAGLTETISGGVGRVVNGGVAETVNGALVQTITGPFTQTVGGALTVKSSSTMFDLGPVEFKKDRHVAVTMGATSDTFIGAKHSATVGMTMTTNLAINTTLSASVDLMFAAAMKATYGSSIILHEVPSKVDTAATLTERYGASSSTIAKVAYKSALWAVNSGLIKLG
jgi:hypothetical protein